MSLKHHTVIFVPHGRSRFRKWRITNRQLLFIASAVSLLTLLSLLTTWSFFTTNIDKNELAKIRSENDQLRTVNQSFESSISELKEQLGEFEERTRQLAIVAGLENLGDAATIGVGGVAEVDPQPSSRQLLSLNERAVEIGDGLARIGHSLEERRQWISSTPAVAPVKGILTSAYGYRPDPITGKRAWHGAIDIATAPGRPVIATADGLVTRSGRVVGLGNAVYLSHGYGLTTRYGHLSRTNVEPGQRVRRGDVIGFVGNTGRSTGYHLHYEVRLDNEQENPLAYILDSTAESAS